MSFPLFVANADLANTFFMFSCRPPVGMKGSILHPHRTSTKTTCSSLSLWGRCSEKLFTRYTMKEMCIAIPGLC